MTRLGAASFDPRAQRIVFLGDSITDGFTYPLLLRQAFADAGLPAPAVINAGIASDTAEGVLARLDRDVFPHRPTLVSLSIGVNDVLRKVTPEQYEERVAAIADRMAAAKIPMLVMTTTVLGPKNAEAERKLADFNAILHRIAERHGWRVAEVNRLMSEARAEGVAVNEPDEVHITFAGYHVMVRAILDALGYPKVPVPGRAKLAVEPGVIPEWKIRAAPEKSPALDAKAVAALKPDGSWKTCTLPEKDPLPHWWADQERQRGFAMSLDKIIGPAKSYQGIALVDSDKARRVHFLPGASLQAIWLNGERIWKVGDAWLGWHAGRERVPAELKAGRNTLVIETGSQFFLSALELQ